MGFLKKDIDVSRLTPEVLFANTLKLFSGSDQQRIQLFKHAFYQVFAFKGVVDGVGVSTLVANTAVALAQLGATVCVIDTSIIAPVQDMLLKTHVVGKEGEKVLDLFDILYTKENILHNSTISNKISVVSFYGKDCNNGDGRTIRDALSSDESEDLITAVLSKMKPQFDFILIDSCSELTKVNAACLQQAQQVIQVWNDTPTVLDNINRFITNCRLLTCPIDKMRFVVLSKMSEKVDADYSKLFSKFHVRELAKTYLSEEIHYQVSIGNSIIYSLSSNDDMINDYSLAVYRIAMHIANLEVDEEGNVVRDTKKIKIKEAILGKKEESKIEIDEGIEVEGGSKDA